MNSNSRILVTGASGMVGRSLVQALKAESYSSVLTPTSLELDALSQTSVQRYFAQYKPEFVFHLAGHIGGIKASIARPVEFMRDNLRMGFNIIDAAKDHGIKKLLNVGSSCIYPKESAQPMREDYLLSGQLEPTNEGYAIAKIATLKLCQYMNDQFGTSFFTLIPCNLYGYNDHFELENSHVISALIYKMHLAKSSKLPQTEIWGSGQSRREFLFVEDFAKAQIHFMKNWSSNVSPPYINIGSGTDQTVEQLAIQIQKIVGFTGTLAFNPDRPDGMPKKLLDVKLANSLGWKAKVDLADGLQKTYNWYLNSQAPETRS